MNNSAIYTLVSNLLFGFQMAQGLFNSLLDIAQDQVENMRPWMILRAEDSSQSVNSSSVFTTAIPLNANFRRWYGRNPIKLVDTNNNPLPFSEVPLANKFDYRLTGQKFFTDYVGKNLYLCGTLTQSYTVHQFFIKKGTQVSANANNVWDFDTYGYSYSPLLGFLIAMQYKGVDYDLVNLQNAGELGKQAAAILTGMVSWDGELQAAGQIGVDPFGQDTGGWSATAGGGRIGG